MHLFLAQDVCWKVQQATLAGVRNLLLLAAVLSNQVWIFDMAFASQHAVGEALRCTWRYHVPNLDPHYYKQEIHIQFKFTYMKQKKLIHQVTQHNITKGELLIST